jgi:BirA family biotin operon repressor/biotin-[acetyl-CoA-carboxylase] ligase
MEPEPLTPNRILHDLQTRAMPGSVYCYGQVGSTMDLARELLADTADAQLPLLVTAEEQTAGRGRKGRPWSARSGQALLCSIGMRPAWLPPSRSVALVWLIAVALCEAVESETGLAARLKWPNDLLVPTSPATWGKAAGILIELSFSRTTIDRAIIGCGININDAPPPEAVRYPATQLSAAAGRPIDRLTFLRAWLRRLDNWYLRLQASAEEELFAAWQSRLHTLGQSVSIETERGIWQGHATAVTREGALVVRTADGRLQTVTAGDIGLLPSV